MNYDLMTISEMEEIYNKLGKEIARRKDTEKAEDWKKLVEQIRLFIKRHGLIDIQNEYGRLSYIDSDTDCTVPGMINISGY